MANEFMAISDGTYTLTESENSNEFYFYRNDENVLTDIENEPMDFYHAYITQKMMNDKVTDIVAKEIYSEISDDRKCIRLTAYDIGEKASRKTNSNVSNRHPNFLKRLFHKIFG